MEREPTTVTGWVQKGYNESPAVQPKIAKKSGNEYWAFQVAEGAGEERRYVTIAYYSEDRPKFTDGDRVTATGELSSFIGNNGRERFWLHVTPEKGGSIAMTGGSIADDGEEPPF